MLPLHYATKVKGGQRLAFLAARKSLKKQDDVSIN